MLDVAEAQARICAAFSVIGTEWVAVGDACGRVLAEDVCAQHDQPPAAMSAMDGYAVRACDVVLGQALSVIGESLAGHPFVGEVSQGQTVRIFTGAVIPTGADAILIQEDATRTDDEVLPQETVATGQFVRPRGLDFTVGWTGLRAGMVMDPRHVGLAASMGHAFLPVRRRPKVALIATGDELRWPGSTPDAGEIISSNTPSLAAMISSWGGDALDLGIVPDQPEPLTRAFHAGAQADLIVTTGGASVGDFDLVQNTAGDAGMALDFWKIRMRPGKPLIFGHLLDRPFLGLPGNPVSAAVCALIFLRGALMTMLGQTTALPIAKVELSEPLPANSIRQDYARGCYADASRQAVFGANIQDSSMFATFAMADVLIVRPPGDPARERGELVDIIDLSRVFGATS